MGMVGFIYTPIMIWEYVDQGLALTYNYVRVNLSWDVQLDNRWP